MLQNLFLCRWEVGASTKSFSAGCCWACVCSHQHTQELAIVRLARVSEQVIVWQAWQQCKNSVNYEVVSGRWVDSASGNGEVCE